MKKIEKVNVRDIVKKHGAPVYVYSLNKLRKSINEIKDLAPVVRYAMKACSNVTVLKEMLNNGIKIDAVSVFECQRAKIHHYYRRLVRRGPLRDVRQGIRPALHRRVAAGTLLRHGCRAGRRYDHRRARSLDAAQGRERRQG